MSNCFKKNIIVKNFDCLNYKFKIWLKLLNCENLIIKKKDNTFFLKMEIYFSG